MPATSVIFGLEGTALTAREREILSKRVDPFGYILFARNIDRSRSRSAP